jgi:pseudouridine-5'-phosphate glycosidase/pseudouridine kinase
MAAKVAVELSKLKDLYGEEDKEMAKMAYCYNQDLELDKEMAKMAYLYNQDLELDKKMAKTASLGQADVDLRRRKRDSTDKTSNIEVNPRDELAHSITKKAAVSTSFPIKPHQRSSKSKSTFKLSVLPTLVQSMFSQILQSKTPDIVVYGSVAMDLSCDYAPLGADAHSPPSELPISPQMHTSNLAALSPSIGGVGCNVALAAHRAGGTTSVLLRSLVAKDL